jgi:hypothetical protein
MVLTVPIDTQSVFSRYKGTQPKNQPTQQGELSLLVITHVCLEKLATKRQDACLQALLKEIKECKQRPCPEWIPESDWLRILTFVETEARQGKFLLHPF